MFKVEGSGKQKGLDMGVKTGITDYNISHLVQCAEQSRTIETAVLTNALILSSGLARGKLRKLRLCDSY